MTSNDTTTATEPDELENPTTTAPDTQTTEDAGGDREAARYRRRLRDTETERDALNVKAEAAQRALVEHIARAAGVRPAALWATTNLSSMLDESGNVEVEMVKRACADAATSLGLPRPPRPDPSQGSTAQGTYPVTDDPWREAFAPRR